MERLRYVINQYGNWSELTIYADRIEAYRAADFSHSLENAKALLETIGKEICSCKGVTLEGTPSTNSILKKAFSAIGYSGDNMVTRISSSLATIGQQIGELRNNIGTTAHGRSLEELRERNNTVDELTREFLLDSTVIVACFLIRAFENNAQIISSPDVDQVAYDASPEFNEFWDDLYGEFAMGDYSYPASEVLYNVDYSAYKVEQTAFGESGDERE